MAERQAGQHDVHHRAKGEAHVEHAQDVAEEVGVADQRDGLEHDGDHEQRPACLTDDAQRPLGTDQAGQQQVEDDDDDEEDDDSAKRLYCDPPACI